MYDPKDDLQHEKAIELDVDVLGHEDGRILAARLTPVWSHRVKGRVILPTDQDGVNRVVPDGARVTWCAAPADAVIDPTHPDLHRLALQVRKRGA